MKKLIQSPFFIFCASLFIFHQIIEKVFHLHWPFFDNYLDNLLFFPIVLSLITLERSFFLKKVNYSLSVFDIIIITLILSVLFEEIIPLYAPQFTKDYLDYLAYFSGSFMFYFFITKKQIT